ncbi:MAG TPA: proline dehydrogenase family protein [Anaerolineae bacterium]|nr:proline dehydrogenase family protein [Anaerolineae bacterium]
MQELIVGVPVSRSMARRFVAGETLADAIEAIRATNAAGMSATLDFLGEHVSNQAEARANADEYIRALQAIQDAGVDSNISIKLTAMGLAMNDQFCYENVRRIVEAAAQRGNFVRIDMEDSPVTDRTLAIYRRLRADFANTGVVIQAYLYRSEEDVRGLMAQGMAHLRLCKGAYDEPPAVAFQDKAEVDQSMTRLIRLMLEGQAQFPGTYPAIASHDHRIINWVKAYAHHHQIPAHRFEFQMLYGIRRDLQQQLAGQGYRMRVYIPYGTRWYPYYMRRLAERPANLFFFARALVGN